VPAGSVNETAAAITGNTGTAVNDTPVLELRQSTITAVDLAAATCSVSIGGDPTSVPNVHYLSNYKPTVGDTCWTLINGPDLLVLDRDGRFGSAAFAGYTVAEVGTLESRTSTSWGNLSTVGPTITINVPASGSLLIGVECFIEKTTLTSAELGAMSWAATGANALPAPNFPLVQVGDFVQNGAVAPGVQTSSVNVITGLTPGSTTFTAKYATSNGTNCNFGNRLIWAIPI
jgi:hypothetical protein